MKYLHKSFSVSLFANAGTAARCKATCATAGHMEPDAKGRCLRCGAKLLRKHYFDYVNEQRSQHVDDSVWRPVEYPLTDNWKVDPQFPGWLVREAGPHGLEHKPDLR